MFCNASLHAHTWYHFNCLLDIARLCVISRSELHGVVDLYFKHDMLYFYIFYKCFDQLISHRPGLAAWRLGGAGDRIALGTGNVEASVGQDLGSCFDAMPPPGQLPRICGAKFVLAIHCRRH